MKAQSVASKCGGKVTRPLDCKFNGVRAEKGDETLHIDHIRDHISQARRDWNYKHLTTLFSICLTLTLSDTLSNER